MKEELTEKMHSEFTVDAETDKMHKCFAVWRHVGINATPEELKSCIEFSGVTINEVLKYKRKFSEVQSSQSLNSHTKKAAK